MTAGPDKVTLTFIVNKEFAEWFNRIVVETDKNKSEFIRTCILLSGETIRKIPSLCNRIQFEDRKQ